MDADFSDIPEIMKQARRWVVWIESKQPFYVNGKPRSGKLDSQADQANMGSFDEAVLALKSGKYLGLGFCLGPDGTGNYWQGIDLDDIADHPGLSLIADDLPGYTEDSPSGAGRHAIGYGRPLKTFISPRSWALRSTHPANTSPSPGKVLG